VAGSESLCPSSVSPHAIRRGAITHHLNSDVPETAVGDRANVSLNVLENHYDQRSKRDRMESAGSTSTTSEALTPLSSSHMFLHIRQIVADHAK